MITLLFYLDNVFCYVFFYSIYFSNRISPFLKCECTGIVIILELLLIYFSALNFTVLQSAVISTYLEREGAFPLAPNTIAFLFLMKILRAVIHKEEEKEREMERDGQREREGEREREEERGQRESVCVRERERERER